MSSNRSETIVAMRREREACLIAATDSTLEELSK